MSGISIDALRRQLEFKAHGKTRRVELLNKAEKRIARERANATKALADIETRLKALDVAGDAVAALRKIHGGHRRAMDQEVAPSRISVPVADMARLENSTYAEMATAGRNATRIATRMEFATEDNGMVWPMPLACASGATGRPPDIQEAGSIDNQADRCLAIPGYAHLGYLVQAQWMTAMALDLAVLHSEKRQNRGTVFEAEFLGNVIDGASAGMRGSSYWEARRPKAI